MDVYEEMRRKSLNHYDLLDFPGSFLAKQAFENSGHVTHQLQPIVSFWSAMEKQPPDALNTCLQNRVFAYSFEILSNPSFHLFVILVYKSRCQLAMSLISLNNRPKQLYG